MEPTTTAAETGGFGSLVVSVWNTGVLGVDLGRILVAAAIFLVFLALRHAMSRWLRDWIERLTQRTASMLDDRIGEALEPPLTFLPVAVGFFLATEYLGLTGAAEALALSVSRSLIVVAIFWALVRLVDPAAHSFHWIERHVTSELATWFWKAVRVMLWLIGGATILEIWGINVVSIIAGFGLLGVAVALGAQDLFKNLISGVLILTEKRLKVGDWVKVDGVVEGVVETIAFRSTKIRQFDKAPVYVPNKEFADGAVVNYGEMTHRRIYWTIGLEYRTTGAQLAKIRQQIEDLIAEDDRYLAPPDATAFVRLDGFSDSSIDLMLYCFTKTRDWGEWLAIKEELLLEIKRIVEGAGAGFAFPSQSLYIESAPDPLARTNGAGGGGAGKSAPAKSEAAASGSAGASASKASAGKSSAGKASASKASATKTGARKSATSKSAATEAPASRKTSAKSAASGSAGTPAE